MAKFTKSMNRKREILQKTIVILQTRLQEYRQTSMSRTSSHSKGREGLQLFSDMMLMKFKPKSLQGVNKAKKSAQIRKSILGNDSPRLSNEDQEKLLNFKLNRLLYLEQSARDTIIIGNYNQLDMIDLDGLTNGFVDTYHYWSFCPGVPIMNFKVNAKKQVMLVHSLNNIMLYTYQTIKSDKKQQPQFVASIQIKDKVRFIQFPTSDLIAIFYEKYFEIYSLSDSFVVQKKLEKKYNIEDRRFHILAVPQAIDNTVNIFFEEVFDKSKVFGLWCIEVNLFSQTIRQNQPYKIYDIQKSLKNQMLLKNYSKQVIVLNLGQEILIASKGYIVDSVNINLQLGDTYLKLIPHRHTLLHIQANFMEIYQFNINTTVFPHRIELSSLDSIEISTRHPNCRMIDVVPVFDHNYAIFYQIQSPQATKGQIFYQFMMSYTVKLSEKINRILNFQSPISEIPDERIETKCDVLRKIGLKDQQIYQQLWKRSSQSSVKDYQFLLSTRNYKIIKGQVESKMRKTAMRFKELIKIEESCLDILKSKISKENCMKQDLHDYFVSHLLLRKLKLFKQIQLIRNKELIERQQIFTMNIQQYYVFKNFKMQDVVEKIGQYLNTGEGSIQQIRTILYHFRFVYRFIYYQILEDIIKQAKTDLKRLLIELPQLLPLNQGQERDKDVLQEGVWGDISQLEWEQSLWYDKIVCINNKELLEEAIESVWFKRNWLIMHDMIPLSKEDILAKNKDNGAPQIFYFFVEKAFQNIKDEDILRDLLRYVQSHYNQFPSNIRKKVILYSKIYEFLHKHDEIKRHRMSFSKFLTLGDPALFQIFFELQKVRKGCLLHDIREIYIMYANNNSQQFNQCLLEYFKSEISEISHLKYLLNRINNEKKEFHSSHQSMYAILVRAMQIKLRVGGPEDIPIDEVLIYLQNIPISSPNSRQIIKDLQKIQKISEQYETLKKMKINMTIREIVENYETVMDKLVDYQIQKFQLCDKTNKKYFITTVYRILAEIQSFKKNIYGQIDNQLAFFILLTKLMERQDKIKLVKVLLEDEYINNYFYLDLNTIQSLVKYMYRWKFSENNIYLDNEKYIITLLQLLPQVNNLKSYMEQEIHFARLLSTPKDPVRYPLSIYTAFPRTEELEAMIKNFDKQTLLSIKIDEVVETMLSIKELSEILDLQVRPSSFEGSLSMIGGCNTSVHIHVNGGSVSNADPNNLSIYDQRNNSMMRSVIKKCQLKNQAIYEVFIKSFILKGLIKESLPLIKKSIKMTDQYDVITIIVLLYRLFSQLNDESKIVLIKMLSLLYSDPIKLLTVVEELVLKEMTSLQISSFLQKQYLKVKEQNINNYNPENLTFNTLFRISENQNQRINKNQLVKKTLIRLKKRRPEFRADFMFDFLFVILCHKPESISIFIKCIGVSKNKLIRSFFSHLITEEIFDELHVLEIMKRVYYFLLKSIKSNRSVESIIDKYKEISIVEDMQVKEPSRLNQIEKKIWGNVKAFEKKKKQILQNNKLNKLQQFLKVDKQKSIKQSLQNIDKPLDNSRHDYVFSDSDDDYDVTEKEVTQSGAQMLTGKVKIDKIKFNKMKERLQFCKKTPIKSRERSQYPDPSNDSGPLIQINEPLLYPLNPLEIKKPSKYKKYFSQDVRSHYDQSSQFIRQDSFDRQSIGSLKRKGSGQLNFSHPIIELEDIDPYEPKSPIKKMGSDKLRAMKGSTSLDLEGNTPKKQILGSDDLFVENKKSQLAYPQISSPKLPKLKNMRMESISEQTQMYQYANEMLSKVYKSYRPQLENQPYSLKALMMERTQNKQQFYRMLPVALQKIYYQPDKDFETALRLIIQIGDKVPEASINKAYTEIYHKIAKIESKYGLQLSMQEFLPFKSLFQTSTSIDQLFEAVKPNIIAICSYDNVQKIAKLISIGFKRSSLQQSILESFLKKEVELLNRQKQKDRIEVDLQLIKQLNAKLNVKMLIELADSVIKKATSTELRKKLVEIFAEAIRVKGKGRDANELKKRFK